MNISLETARKLALWKQGFRRWPDPEKRHLLELIRTLGCVQIDTINVVERSHYLALWSRLGPYSKEHLDQLLYPDREVFEFWAHAASIIPMEHYRYFIHSMKQYRKGLKARAEKHLKEKAYLLDEVLDEIREKGPMSSSDFKDERKRKRRGWWDWKPAKTALEMLFNSGVLMVAYRKNFRRYYDLTENVLPSRIDTTEPTAEERRLFFVRKAIDAMGVAKPRDVSSYYYQWGTMGQLKGATLEKTFEQLLSDDVLGGVIIEGVSEPHYMLTTDYEVARKVAEDETARFDGVTFLSPFDNLTWSKDRDKALFNFVPKLEAYIPRKKRKFGYYNMSILYRDRLIGRLDPKAHRDRKLLEVKLLHFEEDFEPDSVFEGKLADAFRSFAKFNGAEEILFRKIVPENVRLTVSDS
jgi:uncharacterized protein YcaQ